MSQSPPIIYTWTDEAPQLATFSFLPIIRAFAGATGVPVETRDISLAARILAVFPDKLTKEQQIPDGLAELGELVKTPEANVIKLPNISASIPQMKAAIEELRAKGYALPDYPEEPGSDEEREIKARYDKVKGSAVNPVLREGNSDRRAPKAVKDYAKKNPHRMGKWEKGSKTHVSTMTGGDFRHNERSATVPAATTVRIEHEAGGKTTVLKDGIALQQGEIIDGTFMSKKALVAFLEAQVEDAKQQGVLFSLHMKATMMKVSDPIIFGHAVKVFYAPVFEKHAATFEKLGVDPNNGLGDVVDKIASLPDAERKAVEADIQAVYASRPGIAMVNSDKGITNLHVPSDIIIDASMPPMIRDSGGMWNADGELQDCKAVIPDSSYAGVYQAVVEDCQKHGAYDPATMGSVPNVGLMAQKAQEYGSHDKTFQAARRNGLIRVVDKPTAEVLRGARPVETGDIFRMPARPRTSPVRDWVKLAVTRARASERSCSVLARREPGTRRRDHQAKVKAYLPEHDTGGPGPSKS